MSDSELIEKIARAMYGPGWDEEHPWQQEVIYEAARDVLPIVLAQKAEGWEQGYADCWTYHQSEGLSGTENNPYKETP